MPKFKEGDTVVCKRNDSYNITVGKSYTIIQFDPAETVNGFTFPEYATFLDDNGKKCVAHASRFDNATTPESEDE